MEKDQFYTKPKVAADCFNVVQDILKELNIKNPFYVEPSAGTGSFLELMPKERRLGFDIEPKHPEIIQQDFLAFNVNKAPENAVVIGNPPFGFMNQLTIKFVNHAAIFAEVIGFIVPTTFHRYYFAQQLLSSIYLISRTQLPLESFYRVDVPEYKQSCDFLVWSKTLGSFTDQRKRYRRPTKHPDFELVSVDARDADKLEVFLEKITYKEKDFVFAAPSRAYKGHTDAGRIEVNRKNINNGVNWMFFYSNDPDVKQRLLSLNFKQLHENCQFIQSGFNKADVIEAYSQQYRPKSEEARPKQPSIFD